MTDVNIYSAVIGAASGLIGIAGGYFFRSFTGEQGATVRSANAKARVDEINADKTAFELAQDAINEIGKIRKEYQELSSKYEREKKERVKENNERDKRERALEVRVTTLEGEKLSWQKERDELIGKIASLEAKMRRGGLAMK